MVRNILENDVVSTSRLRTSLYSYKIKNIMKVQCDNCKKIFDESEIMFEVHEIPNLFERITPGGIVPFGECLECDALVYPIKT